LSKKTNKELLNITKKYKKNIKRESTKKENSNNKLNILTKITFVF